MKAIECLLDAIQGGSEHTVSPTGRTASRERHDLNHYRAYDAPEYFWFSTEPLSEALRVMYAKMNCLERLAHTKKLAVMQDCGRIRGIEGQIVSFCNQVQIYNLMINVSLQRLHLRYHHLAHQPRKTQLNSSLQPPSCSLHAPQAPSPTPPQPPCSPP